MNVRFAIGGEIEVNDEIDGGDIKAAGCDVGCYKDVTALALEL